MKSTQRMHLMRAVNRQPGLSPAITRRASFRTHYPAWRPVSISLATEKPRCRLTRMRKWKTRCLSSKISNFSKFSNQKIGSLKNPLRYSEHAESLQKHPRSFLDAPRRVWRKLEISWKSRLFGVTKKMSLPRNFSQRIESTQRMQFWIGIDLS